MYGITKNCVTTVAVNAISRPAQTRGDLPRPVQLLRRLRVPRPDRPAGGIRGHGRRDDGEGGAHRGPAHPHLRPHDHHQGRSRVPGPDVENCISDVTWLINAMGPPQWYIDSKLYFKLKV